MMEFLPSKANVLAVRLNGPLQGGDLNAIVARLEPMLGANEKTHIYIESEHFDLPGVAALHDYLPQALGFLHRRHRLGRLAVVTNQRIVRFLTRLESALMPGLSYQTYRLEERDTARAWVDGERALPHQASVKIIESNDPDVLGFEINGKISAIEMAAVSDYFAGTLAQGRPKRLLGRILQFEGMEMFAYVDGDYVTLKLGLMQSLERYAVVGGPVWLRASVKALAPLMKLEIKHFDGDEEQAAWAWLEAQPMREIRLVN